MKMLMKTEWKIKMQIKIKIKTKNTNQNVNDDRKTHIQMQIEIKVAELPRIPYLIDRTKCRPSRHVWLSSSACDLCCAYQLICIMTIRTYTTGARAEMTRQLQGHPMDLFLKISVLHANFCWLGDVEEIIVLGRKLLLGKKIIQGARGDLKSRIAATGHLYGLLTTQDLNCARL